MTAPTYRARDAFFDALQTNDVRHIFGNPGTTENWLLDGLSARSNVQYVSVLHEAIAVFAAAFYAKASASTAVVNLHAAPGLGNAIGAMYAALKAQAPVIVTAGQQDTRMLDRDPLLSHDLVAMASPVTKWSYQVDQPESVHSALAHAFQVAVEPPAGPVFLALPVDVMESGVSPATATVRTNRAESPMPGEAALESAAQLLREARQPAIIVGDDVAEGDAVQAVVSLAEATGSTVHWENLRVHCSFPNQHSNARGALPLDAEGMRRAMGGADLVVMAGGVLCEEVWFSIGSPVPDGTRLLQIESSQVACTGRFSPDMVLVGPLATTIQALAFKLATKTDGQFREQVELRNHRLRTRKETDREAAHARVANLTDRWPVPPVVAMHAIAKVLPTNAIVVDETVSANVELGRALNFQQPGDYFGGRGGGIGQGLPAALGIALANRGRAVVTVSGDGSAMYGIQALWTAARYRLPIVFVILANREYRVLKHNLDTYRQRFALPDNTDYPEMDLNLPPLAFTELSRGMGVTASDPQSLAEFSSTLREAIASGVPWLIELPTEGKGSL